MNEYLVGRFSGLLSGHFIHSWWKRSNEMTGRRIYSHSRETFRRKYSYDKKIPNLESHCRWDKDIENRKTFMGTSDTLSYEGMYRLDWWQVHKYTWRPHISSVNSNAAKILLPNCINNFTVTLTNNRSYICYV